SSARVRLKPSWAHASPTAFGTARVSTAPTLRTTMLGPLRVTNGPMQGTDLFRIPPVHAHAIWRALCRRLDAKERIGRPLKAGRIPSTLDVFTHSRSASDSRGDASCRVEIAIN